ncbi:hypothetical protein MMC31_007865 [Peltigera leucophlebia]|nr:hypothetical protein [Peltigera leucophlebia]
MGILTGFLFSSPASIVAATFSNLALVVARLPLRIARLALVIARLVFVVTRLALFISPVWEPYSQTIYNPLSSSSLREWTAHNTITYGVTYCCLEACCLSTLEALLPEISGIIAAGPKARRAATLKAAKTRADRQTPPLAPPFQQARHPRRRQGNTLREDEDEREKGEEKAQRARQLEMGQADQVATRAAKGQRVENELRARVEAAQRAAAAVGHPGLEEEEVQWENMTELRKREDAVLQGQVWATGSINLGGSGIQSRIIRINGPGLQGGAKAALPVRDATRGVDLFFF